MSTWERLSERLGAESGGITLDWAELEELTGDLPTEARTSASWWLADVAERPEATAWLDAGLRVSAIDPGTSISFVPGPVPWAVAATPPPLAADLADPEPEPEPEISAQTTIPIQPTIPTPSDTWARPATTTPEPPVEPSTATAPAAVTSEGGSAPTPEAAPTAPETMSTSETGPTAPGAASAPSEADRPTPRATPARTTSGGPVSARTTPERPTVATRPDIVLIEEDREQGAVAAPAGDLFIGPLFAREKAYARWTGAPWFILSGEYGLLAPDQVIGPYERRLVTCSAEYRAAWGAWTVARLELLAGPLRRARVEVHAATMAASEALRPHLLGYGAYVLEPLRGLSIPDRIAWYDGTVPRTAGLTSHPAAAGGDPITAALGDAARALRPSDLLAGVDPMLRRPGIYSWFVDDAGAAQLTAGLGSRIAPGLIWIGQAGAVRPGSGLSATTTLRNQIAWVHLGRSVRLSPLRRMLAAILVHDPQSAVTDEDALTDWIQRHLRVAIVAPEDVEHLAEAADRASARLAPQLSVDHADPAVRTLLREARARFDGFDGLG